MWDMVSLCCQDGALLKAGLLVNDFGSSIFGGREEFWTLSFWLFKTFYTHKKLYNTLKEGKRRKKHFLFFFCRLILLPFVSAITTNLLFLKACSAKDWILHAYMGFVVYSGSLRLCRALFLVAFKVYFWPMSASGFSLCCVFARPS